MHRIPLILAALAATFLAAPPAPAQELRGTVLLDGTAQPAAGIIVEARDPATGARVANTLTDARGYFILRLPGPATVAVRGLRIGQRPTDFGSVTLAADEIVTERFALSGLAITLERVNVIGRAVCGRRRADDLQVVTLLEEARKAILSTQLRPADTDLSATWTLRSQLASLRGQPIGDPLVRLFQTTTDRPFQSIPPDSLATVGYFEAMEDGYAFYAPDAEVLLSEAFVEEHCFQAAPWMHDERDWVGLAFRPAQTRRGIVGIQGTMWLDRRSAELRLLEYDYTNLPAFLRTNLAGGEVGFLRLATGAWLVHHWSIRMPRLEERIASSGTGRVQVRRAVQRLRALEVTGGDVREIRDGDRVLFAAEGVEVTPVVRRAVDVAELCADPLGPTEGILWGVLRDSTGAGLAGADVTLDWREGWRWLAADHRLWDSRRVEAVSGDDGFWLACGVARDLPVAVAVRKGERRSAAHVAWIPRDSLGLPLDLALAALPHTAVGTVFGRVIDSLRVDGPWRGAVVQHLGGAARATADDAGRFALDGLPPGEHTLAVWDDDLLFTRLPMPTARVRVAADGSAEPAVLVVPSAATVFAAACGRAAGVNEGILVGELRDLAGARRGGVTVTARWERNLLGGGSNERERFAAEAVSDSLGWFTLCGVPRDGEASAAGGAVVHATGEVTVVAEGAGLRAGALTLRMDGAAVRRRDLIAAPDRERRRIAGVVKDQLGRPLPDATVFVVGADSAATRTNAEGLWTLDGVPARTSQLVVRALRFTPALVDLDPVGGRLAVGELRLANAPQLLESVSIRGIATNTAAAGFDERRRGYGFGTFLDEATLKRQPVVTAAFVVARTPRTRLVDEQVYIETTGSGFSAFTTCKPRWFIDGADNGRIDAWEQRLMLQRALRIEIYRANLAPPQFNDFDGCGAVVIWTR